MERPRPREIIRNFPENGMKILLENPKNVRDLLALTGRGIVEDVDFDRSTSVKETFVKRSYRHVEADVVLHAPLVPEQGGKKRLWIYILIEHQSEKDPAMPLRMLEYVVEIYRFQERGWRRRHGPHARLCLEPVLPVVFYTGSSRWEDVGTLADLVTPGERFQNEIPLLHPLFLSLPAVAPEVLETKGGFFGWILQLTQARNEGRGAFRRLLVRIIRHLESIPEADRVRWQEFLEYIHALVYHVRHPEEQPRLQQEIEASVVTDTRRQEVFRMGKTIAEDLMERGHAEGHARGQLEKARATLIRLLCVRFGELPEKTVAVIQAESDQELLDTWLDRFATAESLEDVGIGS